MTQLQQLYNPMQSIGIYEKTNRETSTGNALQEMMNPQTSPEARRAIPSQIASIAPDEALKLQQVAAQMDETQRQQTAQQYAELASMMQGLDDEESWNEGLRMVNQSFAQQGKPAINVPFSMRQGLIARVLGMKEYFDMRDKAADNVRQDALVSSQVRENNAQANKANYEAGGGGYGGGGGGGGYAPPGGVHDGIVAPWDRIRDPKQRDREVSRQADNYDDFRKKQREREAAANQAVALTQRFKARMNNPDGSMRTTTGGFWGIPGVNEVTSFFDSDYQEMNAISAELTPLMRQGLPGAASDRDVAMFQRATVNTNKRNVTNLSIIEAVQAAAKRVQDYGAFMDAFFQKYGHTVGADALWQQYANENEIFAAGGDDPNQVTVRNDQVPWQQWLQQRAGGGQQAPAPQGGAQPQQGQQPQGGGRPTAVWSKGSPAGDYIVPPALKQRFPKAAYLRSMGDGNLVLYDINGKALEEE